MNTHFLQCAASVSLLLSAIANASAEDLAIGWTSFRNGGESRATGVLPMRWAPDDNIAWQTETDGYGQSAPVIQVDQVIVTSVIGQQKERCAITAYSLADGQQLWHHQFDAAASGAVQLHDVASGTDSGCR